MFVLVITTVLAQTGLRPHHHGRRFVQEWRACPDYCWRAMARLNSVEPRRLICEAEGLESRLKRMSVANFMAFSLVLRFWVILSRTLSLVQYVVVGPLLCYRERGGVANANFATILGGAASGNVASGRAELRKTKTFDSTMGFPGEDVTVHSLW